MVTDFIRICLGVLAAYAVAGTLFALPFHWRGIGHLDPATRGSRLGFRILITPGIIVLWPCLAWRWVVSRPDATRPAGHQPWLDARCLRTWHRVSWQVLAVVVPVLVAAGLSFRPKAVPGSKLDFFRRDEIRPSAANRAR